MTSERQLFELTVNGTVHEVLAEPRKTLLDVLRQDLGLTGAHAGCEHGVCGTCTILVDGEPVRACLMFAVQAEHHEVRTVESLAEPPQEASMETSRKESTEASAEGQGSGQADGRVLSDLQQAFSDHHALQCGFCTPGFLMLAEGFLAQRPDAGREEVRDAISANLCRCTGYQTIVDAVTATAQRRRNAGAGAGERKDGTS